jgi:hypothetical protein
VLVTLAIAACGRLADDTDVGTGGSAGEAPTSGAGVTASTGPAGASDPEHNEPSLPSEHAPPPVTVSAGDTTLELEAWTFCYDALCADGSPPSNPPDIGVADEVTVAFPLEGWTFDASFAPAGERCGREFHTATTPNGDGTFTLAPAGYADTYDVTLFGAGDGDLFVTFRWTTTSDGEIEPPEARLAVLANHDDVVDSYGVELALSNLPQTPDDASATITVTAADGESMSFDATRSRIRCPEGFVYWDGPDRDGLAAAALGEPPFTYDVEVTLDGTTYTATATWPDDEIVGNEPSVPLEFTPALPSG